VPVGVAPDPSYTPITVPGSSGDTLLVFTDGLVERRGESLDVGLERLRDAAAFSDSPSLEGLVSDLVESLVGEGTPDDTILLGLRGASETEVGGPVCPWRRRSGPPACGSPWRGTSPCPTQPISKRCSTGCSPPLPTSTRVAWSSIWAVSDSWTAPGSLCCC